MSNLQIKQMGLFLGFVLVLSNLGIAIDSVKASDGKNQAKFVCEDYQNQYTVMYRPSNQAEIAYPWAVPGRLGNGWTSYRRCQEISRRLESYREDGLKEMGIGVKNGYEIICVTTQKDPSCRIVLTVPPGKDALETRDLVFANIVKADSGQQTSIVRTMVNNGSSPVLDSGNPKSNINLLPHLDPQDGGTATELNK